MVKLDIVRSANAALADATKSFVAVVAGGTAGIGEFTVRAIAATFASHGNGLRVYIVGRNEGAARKIISDCETVCLGGSFSFYKADLSLIRDVDRVCADITRAEQGEAETSHAPAKIDFLVCCQGILSTSHEGTCVGLLTELSEIEERGHITDQLDRDPRRTRQILLSLLLFADAFHRSAASSPDRIPTGRACRFGP